MFLDDTLGSGVARPVLPMVLNDGVGGISPVWETRSTSRATIINQALALIPASVRDVVLGWRIHPTFAAKQRPARLIFATVPQGTSDGTYARRYTLSFLGNGSTVGSWGGLYLGDRIAIDNGSVTSVTHEIGHHFDATMNFELRGSTAFMSTQDVWLSSTIATARSKMLANSMNGMYAYTSPAEWFAEAWAFQFHDDFLGAGGHVGSYRPFYDICGRDASIAGQVRQWFLDLVPDMPRCNWYLYRDGASSNRDKPCITGWGIPSGAAVGAPVSVSLLDESALTTSSWIIQSGSLPAGLSLGSSGNVAQITGTPSAAGAYSFTLRATNADGFLDRIFAGTVGPAA